MSSPADLDRRLSRKIETGKAIQLKPADLDLLVESGALDTFRQFVSEYQKRQCLERSAQNRSIPVAGSPFTEGKVGTSRSSGTIASESVNEAQARVLAILNPGG